MRELPQLQPRGRLYIATGVPYRQALKDYFNQEGNAKVWVLDYGYRAGDLILTAIQTSPRMFIALEVAAADGAGGTNIQVDWDRSVEFTNGILADAVAQRAGIDRFDFQSYYVGSDARRIWKALDEEYRLDRPWFTPERWADLHDERK
ncbi:hypothetical protein ACFWPX_14160 [Nocardia sp. NPDC058518]|uniref:hypothetical protein n=1 Tax=Nocardia sp. NPDC058518 TaxID=3346534 RepID=UPI003652E6CA